MTKFLLEGLTGIVLLGVIAQWVAWRLRLPALLILISIGVIAGPLTGLLSPDAVFGEILSPLVGLSIAIILFEGSLSFRFTDIGRPGAIVRSLVSIGALVSWLLASYFAATLVGLPAPLALLIGAILTISGPTVVVSLLRDLPLRGQLSTILRSEGIALEPVGVTVAVLILGGLFASEDSGSTLRGFFGVLKTGVVGGAVGTVAAFGLLALLRSKRIPDELENPAVFAAVVTAYTAAHNMQPASGLLSATILGMILANQDVIRVKPLADFRENFRIVALSALFIVLSARLDIAFLKEFDGEGLLFLLAIVFIVRPAAVFLSTIRSSLSLQEKIFLSSFAPRGYVAAGLSSLFVLELLDAGYPQAERLGFLTFFVILGTVAIYGLAVPALARALNVAEEKATGVLILGAHDWARSIARELQAASIRVLAVDRNPQNVTAAQRQNIPARSGNIFSGQTLESLSLEGFGAFLGLTQNDEVNNLALIHFAELFGGEHVYQLNVLENQSYESLPQRTRERLLFKPGVTYGEIDRRIAIGDEIRTLILDRSYTRDAFAEQFGSDTLILFVVTEEGEFIVEAAEKEAPLDADSSVIVLIRPELMPTAGEPGAARLTVVTT